MQDCFRQYPEIYGAELAEEEEALQQGEAETPPADVAIPQRAQENIAPTSSETGPMEGKPGSETLVDTQRIHDGTTAQLASTTDVTSDGKEAAKSESNRDKADEGDKQGHGG